LTSPSASFNIASAAFLLGLPSLYQHVSVSLFVIVSIGTVGQHISYVIPVFLRLRLGSDLNWAPSEPPRWQPGPMDAPVGYEIDDDPDRIDAEVRWRLLCTEAYWLTWRTRSDVDAQWAAAWRVVAAYREGTGELVGFARCLSDGVAFAYLGDVVVAPAARGCGLGQALVRAMIDDGPGAGFRWLLFTADAHGLYQRFGFQPADGSCLVRPSAR
jgi:GNAT superfamily N-acetyltransferase